MDRIERIERMRKLDLTLEQIAEIEGISKQRVSQLLNPRRARQYRRDEVLVSTGSAAVMLGVHTNTIRRWANAGKLKCYRLGSRGDRRFQREDVESFRSCTLT